MALIDLYRTGALDRKKRTAAKQNTTTTATTKTATKTTTSKTNAKSSARDTGDTTAQPPANSKVGNNAEKYQDAGRLGGNRQTERTTTAATTTTATTASKSKTTLLDSAREAIAQRSMGSSSSTGSNANLLAEALFQAKYGTALKKTVAEIAQKNASTAKSTKSTATAETTKRTSTARTGTQAKQSAKKTTDAVAANGSTADYALVRQAAAKVDFTDWEKKTTTQQRTALKRSGLTEEEQWTLLNKDSSYVETLSVISDLRDNRADYGLSLAEVEQINGELLSLAAARANASGNGQPYLSTIPRAQMVKFLDEQRDDLLRSIGYLDSDTVGGDVGLWYDGEEEGPMFGPSPTMPQVTPNPQEIPNPQQPPLIEEETTYEDWLKQVARDRQKLWQFLTKLNPNRKNAVMEGLIRQGAKQSKFLEVLVKTMDTVLPEEKRLEWKKQINPIGDPNDLALMMLGQEKWEDFVRKEREPVDDENPQKQTWDESMITNQGVFPSVLGSMGPRGSLQDNGCGPMSLHNVNRILGEDSDFSDVAYEVTRDSTKRTLFGGKMGMNPLTVRPYYEKKGYRVTPYLGDEHVVDKNHDAYLAMYIYEMGENSYGGHYVAAEYDKENDEFITYNDRYRDYPIRLESLSHLQRTDKDKNPNTDDVDEKDEKIFVYIWGIDKRGGAE